MTCDVETKTAEVTRFRSKEASLMSSRGAPPGRVGRKKLAPLEDKEVDVQVAAPGLRPTLPETQKPVKMHNRPGRTHRTPDGRVLTPDGSPRSSTDEADEALIDVEESDVPDRNSLAWQYASLGEMMEQLSCISLDNDTNVDELRALGFASVFRHDDRAPESWKNVTWGEDVQAILLLGSLDQLTKVESESAKKAVLTSHCYKVLQLVKALTQKSTALPVILVLSDVPIWPSSNLQAQYDINCNPTVELMNHFFRAGIADTVILGEGERIQPWRVVASSIRMGAFQDRVGGLQKKMQDHVQSLENEFADMCQYIPAVDDTIVETPGVLPDLSGRVGGRVGQYTFDMLLGKGSFGSVYSARGGPFGSTVAVKEISKKSLSSLDRLALLDRECCVTKYLPNHPAIVRAHEVLHTQSSIYVVMNYAGSLTLDIYMQKFTGMHLHEEGQTASGNVPHVLMDSLFAQLADAVAHVHNAQVCHRDIKPANLIVSLTNGDHPMLSLADFGLAAVVCSKEQLLFDSCGSLPFSAPEVLRSTHNGPGYNGFAADAWSLAVTVVNMAWGYGVVEQNVGWRAGAPKKREKQAEDLEKLEDLWTKSGTPSCCTNIALTISCLLKVKSKDRWSVERVASMCAKYLPERT
eukprot:gnl/TRDRNA2_/TRDRNA2_177933_c0_seq2.p1 gnl/TRDRNA2_/TRDRNA2_177933_c0~~gnl/TRDRNA2_/TRDRNA2_177933_c0_seq2.p1  ORF type:complete len:636 (-),score=102.69 gnl/TRDRNA2_/TRDRNA2_177933_c0_seq2:118-2025(-)